MDASGGIAQAAQRRPANSWSEVGAWAGDGLRREVFFFRSGETELYGSLYAAVEPTRSCGIVACASWGVEADRSDPLQRSVALAMARHGGAGLVFHYPGYGDSYGDLAEASLSGLAQAARDAVAEASRRCAGLEWILAGFMFGASVASVAQVETAVDTLLLVQPALRPGAYFRRLSERPRPLVRGSSATKTIEPGAVPGMAYGYPVPAGIAGCAGESDRAVADALASFSGTGTTIAQEAPAEPVPGRFARVAVPGRWRFGAQSHPELAAAAIEWLDHHAAGGLR